jgi:phage terminase large subunit-like protein
MPSKPECVQYFIDVLDGRVTAGKRIKQLADMMLPRIEDGYKGWHFDYDRGNRPCTFISRFCKLPAGKIGEPFVLEPFQVAMIQTAYGFIDDYGYRQYQEILWELARKNGKTSLSSALLLYALIADGEGAPECYTCATSKAQASLAYGSVIKMVKQSSELSKFVRKGIVADRGEDGIICDRTMGYITPLTNQTRHLDGLNVHFALFDELAACTNRDQYDLLKQGMSARNQPMMLCITTNGFERENLFDDQYNYACGILDGKIEDDRMLPIIYELDDRSEWLNEDCWVKANPGLGTIKKWEALSDNVNKGMQDPSFLPTLMTKDFNMPESRAAAWLTFDEATNDEMFDMSEMGFRYGIAGFDASDTTDLSAAKMLMMRPNDPKIYELSMYWLPEDALQKGDGYRRERDDVPYRLWEERGLLRTVPGNTVPKRVFIEWLEEIKQNLDVYTFAIGYDPWHIIGQDAEQLVQYVGKDRCIAVRQGPKTLSQPMKQFRAQLAGDLIVDNHHPINEWCRMNTSIKSDVNANIQPVKMQGKAKNRIDGFMAELCAYVAMMLHKEEYEANL